MTRELDSDENEEDRPVVVVVDDEQRVCQAFDLWLGDDYLVRQATSGSEALDKMDESVEVVLLDRHMPGMSGSEVLTWIREQGPDCRVAMVTAVDPDFDVVDMPFDDYLSKPVDPRDLRDVVSRLLRIGRYDERMSDLYAVSRKIAALETEKTEIQLKDNSEYERLVRYKEELESELSRIDEYLKDESDESLFDVVNSVGSF